LTDEDLYLAGRDLGQEARYVEALQLQKGDVGKAKEQLIEIANCCGGPCDDYELLVKGDYSLRRRRRQHRVVGVGGSVHRYPTG
jgi:hypothetical protein